MMISKKISAIALAVFSLVHTAMAGETPEIFGPLIRYVFVLPCVPGLLGAHRRVRGGDRK